MDDRERSTAVFTALQRSEKSSVEVQRLAVGDYRVDNRFLFERKRLSDLVQSIVSGRLFNQIVRLVEVERLRLALILEVREMECSGLSICFGQNELVTPRCFLLRMSRRFLSRSCDGKAFEVAFVSLDVEISLLSCWSAIKCVGRAPRNYARAMGGVVDHGLAIAVTMHLMRVYSSASAALTEIHLFAYFAWLEAGQAIVLYWKALQNSSRELAGRIGCD